MKKRIVALMFASVISLSILGGCASQTTPETTEPAPATEEAAQTETAPVEETEKQYITPEQVKDGMSSTEDYVLLDLRKVADYEAGHINGAVSSDLDSTIANNDDETSISNIKTALTDATGSEDGSGKKLVLLCYSGKKYAEAGHRLLNEIGVDNSRVFILEGGYKAWTAAGEEYENLIVAQ